jgi:Lrp/AsnC family leucine-responsive transcriptional regulator
MRCKASKGELMGETGPGKAYDERKPSFSKAYEPLDAADNAIVNMLEADGRATLAQLSQASGLSVSAAQSRVQKLERRGVITGYRAVIDQDKRGLPISAFVSVTPLDYAQESDIPRKLEGVEGIVACYSIAGAPSFLLVVRVASPGRLEELLNLIHRTVPVNTETTLILQTYFAG